MNVTPRQSVLLFMLTLLVGSILLGILQVVHAAPLMTMLLSGVGALLQTTLLVAYWRGWEYARHSMVLLVTLLVALGLQEPFITQSPSFLLFLPPILALVLVGPVWVIGSAIAIFTAILVRAGGQGVYASSEGLVIYGVCIGGLILGRLAGDTARQTAEEDAHRAEAALTCAEQWAQALAQRTEEARSREAQFEVLAETIPIAVCMLSGTRFGYVNSRSTMLTGYTREELLQMPFWSVVHPEFQDMVRERELARMRGEGVCPRYEVKIITRSGEERWLDYAARLITSTQPPVVLGTALDITHNKQHQSEICRPNGREQPAADDDCY